ncbi:hypothetical protein BC567DRAFT_264821 [Phyllosticta citribraziliensis]
MNPFLPFCIVTLIAATSTAADRALEPILGKTVGYSKVLNHCNYSVTVWLSGDLQEEQQMKWILKPLKGEFAHPYMTKNESAGMSIKIRRNNKDHGLKGQRAPLTQLEYRAAFSGNNKTFYDISNVDCGANPGVTNNTHTAGWTNSQDLHPENCPFWRDGFVLDVESPNCRGISCFPGSKMCSNVYYLPNDDELDAAGGRLLHDCEGNSFNMTLHLCPCHDPAARECYLAAQSGTGFNSSRSVVLPKDGFPTTPIDSATVSRQSTFLTLPGTTPSLSDPDPFELQSPSSIVTSQGRSANPFSTIGTMIDKTLLDDRNSDVDRPAHP